MNLTGASRSYGSNIDNFVILDGHISRKGIATRAVNNFSVADKKSCMGKLHLIG